MKDLLSEQSIIFQQIIITLTKILQLLNEKDMDVQFYFNLSKLVDQISDVVTLHIQMTES